MEFKCQGNIVKMVFGDQLHDFFGERGTGDDGDEYKLESKDMVEVMKTAWVDTKLFDNNTYKTLINGTTNYQKRAEEIIKEYGLKDDGFDNIKFNIKNKFIYDTRDTSALIDMYLHYISNSNKINNIDIHVDAVKRNRLFKSAMNRNDISKEISLLNSAQREDIGSDLNVYSTYVSGNLYDMANMDSMYKESIRIGNYLEDKSEREQVYIIKDTEKNQMEWKLTKKPFWYDTCIEIIENFDENKYKELLSDVKIYYNKSVSVFTNDDNKKFSLMGLLKNNINEIIEESIPDKSLGDFKNQKSKPVFNFKARVSEYKSLGEVNFIKFIFKEVDTAATATATATKLLKFQLNCIKSSFEVLFNPEKEDEVKLKLFEPLTLKQIPGYARTIGEEASIDYLKINNKEIDMKNLLKPLYIRGGPSVSNISNYININKKLTPDDKLGLLMCKTLGDLTVITSSFAEGDNKMVNILLTFDKTCAAIARTLSIGGKSLRNNIILQKPSGSYEFDIDYDLAKHLGETGMSYLPQMTENAVIILSNMKQQRQTDENLNKCELYRENLQLTTSKTLPSCSKSYEEIEEGVKYIQLLEPAETLLDFSVGGDRKRKRDD